MALTHASTGKRDIVWINNSKLFCYEPLGENALSCCVTNEKIPRHIIQAWGQFKVSEKPLWQHDCPNSLAVAVTKNAVVVADASQVAAMELRSGKKLWSQTLPSAPMPWGMAVDRTGRVILTLVDSQVLCIGRQEPFQRKPASRNRQRKRAASLTLTRTVARP